MTPGRCKLRADAVALVVAAFIGSMACLGQTPPQAADAFSQLSRGQFVMSSHDGSQFLIIDDREMTILDAEELAPTLTIALDGSMQEFGLPSFSPDGLRVAAPVSDSEVRVWDLSDGSLIARFEVAARPWRSVYFVPSGEALVVLSGMRAELRDATTGEVLEVFEASASFVTKAAVSPDGAVLAIGDLAGVIRLWDMASGDVIAEAMGHTDIVSGLVFHPDGDSLISAGEDGTVRFWDTTGGEVHVISAHEEPIGWVSLSSDGRFLATCSADATVRLWNAVTQEHIATLDLWERIGPLDPDLPVPLSGDPRAGSIVRGADFGPGDRCLIVSYVSGYESVVGIWDLEVVL
jgi:WD40 repeat protein